MELIAQNFVPVVIKLLNEVTKGEVRLTGTSDEKWTKERGKVTDHPSAIID